MNPNKVEIIRTITTSTTNTIVFQYASEGIARCSVSDLRRSYPTATIEVAKRLVMVTQST